MTESRQGPVRAGEPSIARRDIETLILELLRARRPGASICPSEVARDLARRIGTGSWRPLMTPVREAASRLRQLGVVEILQGGRLVDPLEVRGPVRLRLSR